MITKQQLGNFLWGMADILYGKVEDYKSYILTLLFIRDFQTTTLGKRNTKLPNLKGNMELNSTPNN